MSTKFVDVSAAIKAKLDNLSQLKSVYEYEPDKPTDGKYPFATVTLASFEGEFADTIRNSRVIVYSVKIYQERTEKGFGNEKAERVMRETIDEMVTAFDNDTTLSGTVKWIKPASGDFDNIERETGDTRVCDVLLEANVVVDSLT